MTEWDTGRQKDLGRRGENALWHYGKCHENDKHCGDPVRMIRRYHGKELQEKRGDFLIAWDGQRLNVDAKVENLRSPNFPVELVQHDGENGWFRKLTECHAIWYAQVTDGDDVTRYGMRFWCIWRINLLGLRKAFIDARWPLRECNSGYGNTKIALAPLAELERNGVAKLWWST